MEIRETRIPFIDFSLGELSEGQVLLFIADSSTLNDAMLLSMLVTFNLMDQGMACVAVQADEPYFLASKNLGMLFCLISFLF